MNNNPKYQGCPARMSDGRHFTDYRPNCHLNGLIQSQNNIKNSYHYRNFLQDNGSKLMDMNKNHAINKNYCDSCDAVAMENSKMKPLRN